jgi:hypothetical protein
MISVVVEVWDNTTRSSVVAQAKSVREAASIAAAVYPDAAVRVKFPIDPEAFFVKNSAARAEVVSSDRLEEVAA